MVKSNSKKDFLQLVRNHGLALNGDELVLMNGGFGTYLEFINRMGKGASQYLDPIIHQKVERLRTQYILGGARILGTHTYSANRPALQEHGIEDRIEEINLAELAGLQQSIAKARLEGYDNIGNPFPPRFLRYVSIGPSGDGYREDPLYEGNPDRASAAHAPQIEVLFSRDGKPPFDFILAETNPEADEVVGLIKEVRKYDGEIPFVVSWFPNKEGLVPASKMRVSDAIKYVEDGIGEQVLASLNCADMEYIKKAVLQSDQKEMENIVGIYPNPHHETEHLKDKSDEMETYDRRHLKGLVNDIRHLKQDHTPNLTMVGICCGSTPDDTAMLNTLIHPEKEEGHHVRKGGMRT